MAKRTKTKRGPEKGQTYDMAPPTVSVETAQPPPPDPPSVATECPACKSARRTPYYSRRRMVYDGQVILWRRCKCLDCGQIRVDRISYPIGAEPPSENGEAPV
ncbi:MAG TPA: hypothetical protein VMY35_17025 [Phycisphaerae bacterium]|nr:hypothetical protein [Phycisphaerae bacterium]